MARSSPPPRTGPRRPVVTTSWDDGHRLDLRLADLLDRHGVPGTFYIAPANREFERGHLLSSREVGQIAQRFEIGGHTHTHPRLSGLSDEAAHEEIRVGRQVLEDQTQAPITSFCYPAGDYTPAHVRSVRRLGFTVARTIRRGSLTPGPLFELGTTVHAYAHRRDGPQALRLAGRRPWRAVGLYLAWDELAIRWFDRCLRDGGVFHLWGHSWEMDARGEWGRLERVLRHISGRASVSYVSNGDLPSLLAEDAS